MNKSNHDINIYIEGLLVQTRSVESIMSWAFAGAMLNTSNAISSEIALRFIDHVKSNDDTVWAHHFKDFDAYAVMKPSTTKIGKDIIISFNEYDRNKPNLKVICTLNLPTISPNFIAALTTLGVYYIADDLIIGDKNERSIPDKGND